MRISARDFGVGRQGDRKDHSSLWEDSYHLPGVEYVLALHCTRKQSLRTVFPLREHPELGLGRKHEKAGGKGGSQAMTGYIVFLIPELPKDFQPHLQWWSAAVCP